jgi:phage tail sheath protein FI
MSTLVSPGVSVTIIDDSFYIPVSAPTVPLFFIATQANKLQTDGVTLAAYTAEHSIVRTITSIGQMTTSYGVPAFRTDPADANLPISAQAQLYGDSRNEYGLFALYQYLGIGNVAYVVRADVDLNDAPIVSITASTPAFTSVTQATAGQKGSLGTVTVEAGAVVESWTLVCTAAGSPATFSVTGSVSGVQAPATVGVAYNNTKVGFTIAAGSAAYEVGDSYTFTLTSSITGYSLGNNDAAKRAAITTALIGEINSNQDVRSEIYEYNIIVCPGYFECVSALVALATDINNEAFVIGDTPFTMSAEDTATWAQTSARVNSTGCAYYYPHGLASNLNGVDVFVASSGIALRTIAYSDSVSEVWFAPAGVNRGLVTGVDSFGYVSGTLGTDTTFVPVNLNQGQRDVLYQDFANINPIAYFPGQGYLVFGQKTSASADSALDRINVSRLLMYIKRQLRKGAFAFLFEPNDQITRDNLKAAVDGFLSDIMINRGLYDFVTLCDTSNNTPTLIDNNQLWCDVALIPTKAAEFIYIPITVMSTGATLPGGGTTGDTGSTGD